MLNYVTVPVTKFKQNSSIIWCDRTLDAAVIDPGGDIEILLGKIQALGLTLTQIFVTHAHIDHAGAIATLITLNKKLRTIGPNKNDLYWIERLKSQSEIFGFPSANSFIPDKWLEDLDEVTVGESKLTVRHCPGHTAGHVVFHSSEISRVFVGDVLFVGSIGRTDLPCANHLDLISSIKNRLWPMGDSTIFIPGHGPEGSIGHERATNPFLR